MQDSPKNCPRTSMVNANNNRTDMMHGPAILTSYSLRQKYTFRRIDGSIEDEHVSPRGPVPASSSPVPFLLNPKSPPQKGRKYVDGTETKNVVPALRPNTTNAVFMA
ncbi:hypothetical protein EVAR_13777_1 [Eumeta japonica]|uniref:Uncharacterized protein n=1 Tax=Eumeta variegata TaxID=151549 RepID=A0A4C1U0Y9_EUMVA|nr:hypothetical protein EVAR_13777_1 [Eumeta japonica]